MSVKAKFRVHHVERSKGLEGETIGVNVAMSPVYSSDPAAENYSWSQATPGGHLSMYISNPAAFDSFELNGEYLLTFEKVGA